MKVIVVILLVILLGVLTLLAYKNTANRIPNLGLIENSKSNDKKDKKSKKEIAKERPINSNSIQVIQRWNMPEVLTEVSDISNIDGNLVACIQDEIGTIFLYNTMAKKIEKEIPFAGKGDYEGIALAGNVSYVINSSGVLYEVDNIDKTKPSVKKYKTFLTAKDDVEALCYDKENNRLLIAFKGDEGKGSTKGIYSFDLKSKELAKNPVYTIDLESSLFNEANGNKKKREIKPSAIAIHPVTGDIYITEGSNPKILILDKQGKALSFFISLVIFKVVKLCLFLSQFNPTVRLSRIYFI